MSKKRNNNKNPLQRNLGSKEDKFNQKREPKVVFSFIDLDRNQGQTFEEWEKEGLTIQLLEKLASISTMTRMEANHSQTIKQYTKVSFPPNSEFNHPKHVPEQVTWCSMHLQGKECVIGYFEENLFKIVFLDREHKFWPSIKK
jgi:CRISPR/Cas system-associated protein Cas5 (RAMP superfamily)